jgi:hypothetical protein
MAQCKGQIFLGEGETVRCPSEAVTKERLADVEGPGKKDAGLCPMHWTRKYGALPVLTPSPAGEA